MRIIAPVSAFNKVYILAVTDIAPDIWTDTTLNQLRIGAIKTAPTYDAYVWDLQSLAYYIGDYENADNTLRVDRGSIRYLTVDRNDPNWHQIWIEGFNDDAGSKAIERLPTIFAVSPFNKIVNENYKYDVNFNFSPLVTLNYDTALGNTLPETWYGENAIWQSVIIPGFPLLFSSSLPEHQHFGPCFPTHIKFSCVGTDSLAAVEVSVSLSGARSLRSPVMDVVSPELMPVNNSVGVGSNFYSYSEVAKVYRAASILDCMAGYNIWTDVASMRSDLYDDISQESIEPELRLVGIELNIEQKVAYKTTEPVTGFDEQHGPRFASITERVVTGSLQYFSRTNSMEQDLTGPLTLYFGGPFLFPMPNIEWQKAEAAVKAGDGWIRTYKFIARTADDAIVLPFQDNSPNTYCSEFAMATITEDDTVDLGDGE